jgi:hypothetical protein
MIREAIELYLESLEAHGDIAASGVSRDEFQRLL